MSLLLRGEADVGQSHHSSHHFSGLMGYKPAARIVFFFTLTRACYRKQSAIGRPEVRRHVYSRNRACGTILRRPQRIQSGAWASGARGRKMTETQTLAKTTHVSTLKRWHYYQQCILRTKTHSSFYLLQELFRNQNSVMNWNTKPCT